MKNVKLDFLTFKAEKGEAKWVFNIPWFILILFVGFPIQVWATELRDRFWPDFHALPWITFGLLFLVCISMTIISRNSLYKMHDPMIYHRLGSWFANFRLMYLSSILFYGLVNPVMSLCVIPFWLLSEWANFCEREHVSDSQLEADYEGRFQEAENGTVLYNPLHETKGSLSQIQRSIWIKWWIIFEKYGSGIVGVLTPFLFINSFLYRDNFEPRFIIVGSIAFAGALFSRRMTTIAGLARRAIDLKRRKTKLAV